MRTSLVLLLAASVASACHAQELVRISYSFTEVQPGSTVPAIGPLAGNGKVDPGEAARIFIGLNIL